MLCSSQVMLPKSKTSYTKARSTLGYRRKTVAVREYPGRFDSRVVGGSKRRTNIVDKILQNTNKIREISPKKSSGY